MNKATKGPGWYLTWMFYLIHITRLTYLQARTTGDKTPFIGGPARYSRETTPEFVEVSLREIVYFRILATARRKPSPLSVES